MTIGTLNDRRKPLDNVWGFGWPIGSLKFLQSCKQFLQITAIPFHLAILKTRQLADVHGSDLGDLRKSFSKRFSPLTKFRAKRFRVGDRLASLLHFA